jgi:superfamily II DNA/RNA helicase
VLRILNTVKVPLIVTVKLFENTSSADVGNTPPFQVAVLLQFPFATAYLKAIIKDFLTKQKVTCEVINGEVPVHKRTEVFKKFQEDTDPKVLLIQPQAAAHGVTLTAANVVIWYAPITSIEYYLQANARVHRQGQKNPVTVVHLEGSPVETKLYAALQDKLGYHTKIIDLYKNEINE